MSKGNGARRSFADGVTTGKRIRITRCGRAVPLITSRRLVCINADVSIQLRPSSFPRYVVASSHVGAALRALRASQRPPRWPLLWPRRGMLQPPSFNPPPRRPKDATQVDLTAGMRRADRHPASFRARNSLRAPSSLLISCFIHANVVATTHLAINSVTWNTAMGVKRCLLACHIRMPA